MIKFKQGTRGSNIFVFVFAHKQEGDGERDAQRYLPPAVDTHINNCHMLAQLIATCGHQLAFVASMTGFVSTARFVSIFDTQIHG